MACLELAGIQLRYGAEVVLRDIDLRVEDGEFLAVVGPSGCGKSSLLRIIAGLLKPTSGELRLDGVALQDASPVERDVALVFQNYALYPHMSVRNNLAFPLRMARLARAEIEQRVRQTAALLGLEDLLERKPAALSGGQMQRVAVGRAVIRNPRLFLFDEPLSNLDAQLREEMRLSLRKLHERLGITTVYVTHDQAEAMTMGSRLCVLQRGAIEQCGAPLAVFDRPATTFVASFLGSPPMNLIRGEARAGRFSAGEFCCNAPPALAGACILGLRPHEIEWQGELPAHVVWMEALGTRTTIECAVGNQRLRIVREGRCELASGAKVGLRWSDACARWFDATSQKAIAL